MSRYIDADILISYIRDVGLLGDGYSHDERENNVCDMIEYIKTADVQEVKHGHWERTKDGAARCTACGRKMNPYLYGYLHCAMCGAIMDERGKK